MVKRMLIRLCSGILAVSLLSFAIISISTGDADAIFTKNSNAYVKVQTSHTISIVSELFEEKEVKNDNEDFQVVVISHLPNEAAFAQLLSIVTRLKNHSVASFGNTTNLPLYLAKRSFLI